MVVPSPLNTSQTKLILGLGLLCYGFIIGMEYGRRQERKANRDMELWSKVYSMEAKARVSEAKEAGLIEPLPVRVVE